MKPRKPQIQSTNWTFTLNNYTEDEVLHIGGLVVDDHPFDHSSSVVRSLACSEEVGKTGTPHLQGYLQLSLKVSLPVMKQLSGLERAHFEVMRGSFLQNEAYCAKQATLTHFGVPFVGKGGRVDRNEIFAMLAEGKSDKELMESDFSGYCRMRNGISDYRSMVMPERVSPVEIYLFFGEPGTGKTKFAIQQLGPNYYRMPISKDMWFTKRMAGRTHILIDEFRSNVPLFMLLQLLDENPLEVPNKGGFMWYLPEIIIITTNRSPWDWYNYNNKRDKERKALFRRFDSGGVFRFFKNDEKVPVPQRIDIYDRHAFDYPDSDSDEEQWNIPQGAIDYMARQNHYAQAGMIVQEEEVNVL